MEKEEVKKFLGKKVKLIVKDFFYKGEIKELRTECIYFYDFKLKTVINITYRIIDGILPIGGQNE